MTGALIIVLAIFAAAALVRIGWDAGATLPGAIVEGIRLIAAVLLIVFFLLCCGIAATVGAIGWAASSIYYLGKRHG